MSPSLVLIPQTSVLPGIYQLAIRYHDLSGTDYSRIATMDGDTARDLVASKTGVDFLTGKLPETPERRPGRLFVTPRPDPKPDTALWILNIQRASGLHKIAYINDEKLNALMATDAKIGFPEGEPNWKRHDEVLTRLRINELRAEADRLEATLDTPKAVSVPLDGIPARITGIAGYGWESSADLPGGQKLHIFKLPEWHEAIDDGMGEMHLIADAAGGYRAQLPTGQVLREGHLSDFAEPGFRVRSVVELDVTDPDAFREAFGIEPGAGAADGGLTKLLNMEPEIAEVLKVERAELRATEGGAFILTIEASAENEAELMADLRRVYSDCWGGADGFPTTREGAVFEACLASNANPSPDTCGFQINDWYPPQAAEIEPEALSAPSGLSF